MWIRVRMLQGDDLRLDVDLDEWNRAFQEALSSNAMLQVHDPRGGVLGINPHHIVYQVQDPLPRERESAAA